MAVATPCRFQKTNTNKSWSYFEYYTGGKDEEQRKHGQGEHHWSGAESLERYHGRFIRDTMHGEGDYYWRHLGPEGAFVTYEGNFFNNQLHGYGCISYGDGRVFKGLLHSNMRWGPGIESHACVRENVGLWDGRKLVRLCWRPDGPSIAPDLMSSDIGREVVKRHRNILKRSVKMMGEVNSALELLKCCGANPVTAIDKWSKVYPKHCTDLSSALCNSKMFENEYYVGNLFTLDENAKIPDHTEIDTSEDTKEISSYYAWNNNEIIKHMMKHSYKHEIQRRKLDLDIATILTGPRNYFKLAGQHEIDSRTLLMASYLGHISQVAQLINENKIHPDVADIQGNTALMYATCGERADIINFLVEAGANVNSYNDSCCTPLGVALIKLVCSQQDIPANGVLQALLPTSVTSLPNASEEKQVSEWPVLREAQSPSVGGTLTKSPSKINKNLSSKKIKSLISLKDQAGKKKSEAVSLKGPDEISNESFSEEKRLYNNISREYYIRITDVYQTFNTNPLQYIFEVNDMIKEVEANEEDQKKLPDKNPKKVVSRVLKELTKPSKDAMWQGDKDENKSMDSVEKQKRDMITRIMTTIFQLLCNGAKPKLAKCPQSAIFIAIISGSSEAVSHLICHGADINEIHSEVLGYTPLDIAISRPFTYDNLEIIKTILQYGADTQHRLIYKVTDGKTTEILGPTLFHAVLARRTENEIEDEIRNQILELLLDYHCNPTAQFKGRSAVDISMTKSMNIFDIFIKHPKTNLNLVINDVNQNVLVKMFYLPFFKTFPGTERLQKITDLLLFGANPLIKCQNGEEKYENIFVFAKKTLNDIEGTQTKVVTPTGAASKQDKKVDKAKKDDKISTKSMGKITDDLGEYKQSLELVTECARLLHIRWLQGKLVKEVIEVINKFKHRHWNMILKEVQNKKNLGLWLTPQRCLEIWYIITKGKKNAYGDRKILKHLLNIIQFCTIRIMNGISLRKPLTAVEKGIVEKDINFLLLDHKICNSLDSEVLWRRYYVKPELISNNAKTFNVCFECALPLREDKILCISCKIISFCSVECIKGNIDRPSCHPCSYILKEKYFHNNSDTNTN